MRGHLQFQTATLYVLQEAAEAYLIPLFKDSKHVTVMPKDIPLANILEENIVKRREHYWELYIVDSKARSYCECYHFKFVTLVVHTIILVWSDKINISLVHTI